MELFFSIVSISVLLLLTAFITLAFKSILVDQKKKALDNNLESQEFKSRKPLIGSTKISLNLEAKVEKYYSTLISLVEKSKESILV